MGFELTGATPDERLKELTEKLEQGVSEIFTSGRYAEYLSAMSKFHTYSFGNVMLILMQNPAASCVAGFHTWKKEFGRNVKAHESGLKILAPCPYRRFIEQDKLDKDGTPVLDAAGKPLRERTLVQLMRFRIVTVFDISQTEGKELPSIGVSERFAGSHFICRAAQRGQGLLQSCHGGNSRPPWHEPEADRQDHAP